MNKAATKVAIVTGGSKGIGAGAVAAFRQRGYSVVANSRHIRPFDDPGIVTVPGNIGKRDVARQVVEAALERFGRIDTVINNAGIFIAKPFTDYTDEDFRSALEVNIDGFFHLTQLALPQMLRQGSGHIVQISTSMVGAPIAGVPTALASLTKGGLDAVTRSLAIEYASHGIRVNAVCPGIVRTPMHAPETHEFFASLHPLRRMAEVSDIVGALMYLEDATFITGETLNVDGGQQAGRG